MGGETIFAVPYKPSARTPYKTLIVDVFTVLLLSTGHGADHVETLFRLSELLHNLATDSLAECIFTGTCLPSRCLVMGVRVSVCTSDMGRISKVY
jgi:hypothetical protein